jgi:hypothetical protein
MNRSNSCIRKITWFLSLISIRMLCPTVFHVFKVKFNRPTKFSRMNCTVLQLFFLPQPHIHPSPAFRITTPSPGLGKVRYFKTRCLARIALKDQCANIVFVSDSSHSPTAFDYIHNLKPLQELCTEVHLEPVSRTRKMKTTKNRIGNELSSFRPQSFAMLFYR